MCVISERARKKIVATNNYRAHLFKENKMKKYSPYTVCLNFIEDRGHYCVEEIVRMLNEGKTDKEIARYLKCSRAAWLRRKAIMFKYIAVLTNVMEDALLTLNASERYNIEERRAIVEENKKLKLIYFKGEDVQSDRESA